ncbi:MAG: hypothetical protein CL512_06565 [Actinobacteria bacterium]|nr:hypothetical protein [Actinomycetota bacterium]
MGKLDIIIGPMYAGKTTRLIEIYKRYKLCNIPVFVINHSSDKRYGQTDLHNHENVTIPCVQCSDSLSDLNKSHRSQLENAKVILINEAQFFEDLFVWVKALVEKRVNSPDVYIFGLDADSERREFGQILSLIPLCDSVTKLNAICVDCRDGTPGIFSYRIVENDEQKFIGGVESYKALCRKCYNSQTSKVVSNKKADIYCDVEDVVVYNNIRAKF